MTSNKPQITALEVNPKYPEKRDVFVDGEFYISAPLLLLREQDLSVGSDFGEAEQRSLLIAAELIPAKEKAYQYLGYGDLSRAKLFEKLTRYGIDPQIAELTCDEMEKRGYIDDQRLAQTMARRFAESKRWGTRRILPELRQRGIPDELAREAVDALETNFYETARYHVENKYRRYDLTDRKERDKVFQGLLRLGFDFDEARSALEENDD